MGADFNGLAIFLVGKAREILPQWLPSGKFVGKEFVCGNLRGEPGESLSVNILTGQWADFSSSEKGGDLTSLYAAIHGISQKDAYDRLVEISGYSSGQTSQRALVHQPTVVVCKPPHDAPPPNDSSASATYSYRSESGDLLYVVCRHDDESGKLFRPWSWDGSRWINKSWPAPRPLYGLELLNSKPILLVEGEKAAHAARAFASEKYTVMTWPNGANSWNKADWEPLSGRHVLLWPDADKPGVDAMLGIAQILRSKKCQVKLIDTEGLDEGVDAADFKFTWDEFYKWAKPRAIEYPIAREPEVQRIAPIPTARIEVVKQDVPDAVKETYGALWERCGVALTKQGHPIVNMDNVLRVMEGVADLKACVWYDEFHNKILTENGRPWANHDDISLTIKLQREYGLTKITTAIVRDAIVHLAKLNQKNEPRDWMETLIWDGTPRIESFFHLYLGAKPTEFSMGASKNWWVSMAARIFKPGCKVDTMVILEGEQGAKKSSTLEAIGGRWYKQLTEHFDSKDLYIGFQGKLIIEVAELDAFRKADTSTIKKIISNPSDHYRPLYERQNNEAPRRCVFVGTTNHGAYLEDETGARRFWPIECTSIDLDAVKRDRDQLFAEAVHAFKAGATWWEMPRQPTIDEQEKRYRGDAWDDAIAEYLDTGLTLIDTRAEVPPKKAPLQEVTIAKVAIDALQIEASRIDLSVTKRIGRALRKRGWMPKTVREGKDFRRYWVRA